MRKSGRRRTIAALVALVIAGCGSGASPSPSSTGLRVVTTTTVFADIVGNVGGNRIADRGTAGAGTHRVQKVFKLMCRGRQLVEAVRSSVRLQVVDVAEQCVDDFACRRAITSNFAQLLDGGEYRICVHYSSVSG